MQSALLVVHILMAFCLISFILLQQGKGADAGAAFGSGASSTVFGAAGSASFLTKATAVLALLFFSNSFLLSYLASKPVADKSLMEKMEKGALTEVEEFTIKEIPAADNAEIPRPPGDAASDLPPVPEAFQAVPDLPEPGQAPGDAASNAKPMPQAPPVKAPGDLPAAPAP